MSIVLWVSGHGRAVHTMRRRGLLQHARLCRAQEEVVRLPCTQQGVVRTGRLNSALTSLSVAGRAPPSKFTQIFRKHSACTHTVNAYSRHTSSLVRGRKEERRVTWRGGDAHKACASAFSHTQSPVDAYSIQINRFARTCVQIAVIVSWLNELLLDHL